MKRITALILAVVMCALLFLPVTADTENTASEYDDNPIIIIPGIMGSRLFSSSSVFNDYTRIWDPIIDSDYLLNPMNIKAVTALRYALPGIAFVRPCENQHKYENGGSSLSYGREYGALDTYQPLVDALCDTFPGRGIYFFSYDWRKSNDQSSDKLRAAIDRVLSETGAEKVDIIGHSMGGLVLASYYSKYAADGKLGRTVTCGTPYEGAPQLLNCVLTSNVLSNSAANIALYWLGGVTGIMKSSFSGVAELTPDYGYVSRVPMLKTEGKSKNKTVKELSFEEYSDICSRIFGKRDYADVLAFQDSIKVGGDREAYCKLLDYENSYYIMGDGLQTISAVTFKRLTTGLEDDLTYTNRGDGTVPFLSASLLDNISRVPESRVRVFNVDHQGTAASSKAISCIEDFLTIGYTLIPGDVIDTDDYTVLKIDSAADVEITDGSECLEASGEALRTSADFGRLDITESGTKMMCLDRGSYELKLFGKKDETANLTVRLFSDDGTLKDEYFFENVPLTAKTVVTSRITESGAVKLFIDKNGDGITDSIRTAAHK